MSLCKATLRMASKPIRSNIQPLIVTRSISHPASASSPSTSPLAPRHFLSIGDLTPKELSTLVRQTAKAKDVIEKGNVPSPLRGTLAGKTVALMFSKKSTRTRVSTEAAVAHMGGRPMFLRKDEIQLGANESLHDTSKVISSMTSCIFARVGPHSDIIKLAKASTVPIISALSDTYHPLQAVTDVFTISEAFGKLEGLKVAWVGDANNVLHDLMIACAKLGINISVATPSEYPLDPNILKISQQAATGSGSIIEIGNDPEMAVKNANVIATDTWVSMGQESEKALRLKQFAGFQVSMELAKRGGADKDWKFMHCLPRGQEEVTTEVFYSPKSLVFMQAENRLYAALAVLEAFVVKKGQFEE